MDLSPLMKPGSVAVVGASQRMSRATRVVANLQRFGYAGRIYPINPKYAEVLGLPCFPDLASTPAPADVVVVAIPAAEVPELLAGAVDVGVRAAVILSSGFAEAGPAGKARQAALEKLAADRGLLVCGPNCYGVFNLRAAVATFSADLAEPLRPGPVGLVSQSGGFSHAIAEHLMQQRRVGLSYIVSCGNQCGVTVEEYAEFLVEDDETQVIGLFVEGFKQPKKLSQVAARAKERGKAIVALKVGQSENAREAMLAHTGSLAGTPEVVAAALAQWGIVRVESLNEMLDTLALLAAAGGHRRGWRVTVLSGLGGECGRLSDAAERARVELPPLSATSIAELRSFMPDFANPRNPLDGTGAMYENPELFPRLLDVALRDDATDVLAVNLRANVPRPGGWAPSRQFAESIARAVAHGGDRLVACFSSFAGGDLDPEVVSTLAAAGVPFLEGTETALAALRHAREHRRFLDAPADDPRPPAASAARVPVAGRRGALGHAEAMDLLRGFGIPLADTLSVAGADAAVAAAERLGYPVVVKVDSPDIAHKTDVGGVRVGCADAGQVGRAGEEILAEAARRSPGARIDGLLVQRMVAGGTEMIVGVKRDAVFGPAVVCGLGGVLVELLRDVSIRVPPFGLRTAHQMLGELRGAGLLAGARGRPPADVGALADVLARVAALAHALGTRLVALDLNPVLVLPEGRGAVAVDWLIELD